MEGEQDGRMRIREGYSFGGMEEWMIGDGYISGRDGYFLRRKDSEGKEDVAPPASCPRQFVSCTKQISLLPMMKKIGAEVWRALITALINDRSPSCLLNSSGLSALEYLSDVK